MSKYLNRQKYCSTLIKKRILEKLGLWRDVPRGLRKRGNEAVNEALIDRMIAVMVKTLELQKRLLNQKPVSFQVKYIKCGRKNCSQCPHGPYAYAFWRGEHGTRSEYLGKVESADWLTLPR